MQIRRFDHHELKRGAITLRAQCSRQSLDVDPNPHSKSVIKIWCRHPHPTHHPSPDC